MKEPVHLIHHTLGYGGGMERYALTLAASLRELGHKVTFHARKADATIARSLGVNLEMLPVGPFPRKLQDFRFFRRVDRLRGDFEGLQIALSRVRVKDVMICGGPHRGYLNHARKWAGFFDRLQIWMESQAYGCARVIVSHSDLCTGELIRLYQVPKEKIVTLYPPVDARFTPGSDAGGQAESRRKLRLPSDKPVLLFPSMGHSRKGLKPICEALNGMAEPFVLAVAGKPTGRANHPFLYPLGYVEDMTTAYQAADFTILGSYYEPFGLVGPESILCGTRLIFEEGIGCLTAVKPEFVFTFSVWDRASIRRAVSQALALARQGAHRISRPLEALRYNPSPAEHARALLRAAGASDIK
ncbi:MAG TPA: glycosyltransferase [Verrucomicrobiae bacterium]